MTLHALGLAASAFRRHPYPFATTGLIAFALNALGLIHPILALVVSIFLLPMMYVGLGTLAEAEPGLRFSQALRLALSAWPRMAALGAMMTVFFAALSLLIGSALTMLYGSELLELAQTYESNPEGFVQALSTHVNWAQSGFGLAALGLLTLGLIAMVWSAPMALLHYNLSVISALRWSVAAGRQHFGKLLTAVLLWVFLSVFSGALVGLNVLLWPITALFHFFCFRELGKQGA